jgi:hypothetical protein
MGDPWRPVIMDEHEFEDACYTNSFHWWMWDVFDEHCASLEEMKEDVEFKFGNNININNPIKLCFPVTRVAKYKTKNGKQSLVTVYHIPPGRSYDPAITKKRAELAYDDYNRGHWTLYESMIRNKSRWSAINKYTPYIPERKVKIKEKIKRTCQLILDGNTLNNAIKLTQLTKQTFYKHTGGSKLLISSNEKLKSFNS